MQQWLEDWWWSLAGAGACVFITSMVAMWRRDRRRGRRWVMPKPWLWPERLLDHTSKRRLRREEMLVNDGHDSERSLWRGVAVAFLVGITALLVASFDVEPWSTIAFPVLGWMVGQAAFGGLARASAYRSGWLNGRMRFVSQMNSHKERGNTAEDWLYTEADFDFVHVCGMTPLPRGYSAPLEWDE